MSTASSKIGMTPPHPGEFILDEILSELNLSVSKAADVLGVRNARGARPHYTGSFRCISLWKNRARRS